MDWDKLSLHSKEEYMILTRKLALKARKKEDLGYLYTLNNSVFKAYNTVVNTLYFSYLFKDKITLTDAELAKRREKISRELVKIRGKISLIDKDDKTKLDNLKKRRKGFYNKLNTLTREARDRAEEYYTTSEKNYGYQIISKEFPDIPSYIRACINVEVYANFTKDINRIRNGEISVRTYRKGTPIPFMASAGKFIKDEDNIIFKWLKGIEFDIQFGRDKSARKSEVEKIISGDLKMSDSKIQIKNRKIFLLLAIDQPVEKKDLNMNITVGVDVGIKYPAYVSTNSGIQHKHIGSIDDLFKLRMQIQKRRQRLQKQIKSAKGGKGRGKKLKALNRMREKERNYVRTYNHYISREVVNFALENRAGTIIMEDLSGFGVNYKKKNTILRNWSYFELQSMIDYKAKLMGIKVEKIKPEYTSQTCALCGMKGKREEREIFICLNSECKNFEKPINADYNAAMNISRRGIKK